MNIYIESNRLNQDIFSRRKYFHCKRNIVSLLRTEIYSQSSLSKTDEKSTDWNCRCLQLNYLYFRYLRFILFNSIFAMAIYMNWIAYATIVFVSLKKVHNQQKNGFNFFFLRIFISTLFDLFSHQSIQSLNAINITHSIEVTLLYSIS